MNRSAIRNVLVPLVLLVVVIVGTIGLRQWRTRDAFCQAVHSLPDIAAETQRTGSPVIGLLRHADGLDLVASWAPDPATRDAANTLATAERQSAEALRGGPVSASTVSAIASAASPATASAQTTLQATVTKRCD